MTVFEAADAIKRYIADAPRPTISGENAKAQCLFQALMELREGGHRELHELLYGYLPRCSEKTKCVNSPAILALIVDRAKRARKKFHGAACLLEMHKRIA